MENIDRTYSMYEELSLDEWVSGKLDLEHQVPLCDFIKNCEPEICDEEVCNYELCNGDNINVCDGEQPCHDEGVYESENLNEGCDTIMGDAMDTIMDVSMHENGIETIEETECEQPDGSITRVAILLGGRIVTSSETRDKVLEHLLAYKKRYPFVYFFISINEHVHDEEFMQWFCAHLGIPAECVQIKKTEEPLEVYEYMRRPETRVSNVYSMFYHTNQCMHMARAYSKKYDLTFDVVMKYRADIVPFARSDDVADNTIIRFAYPANDKTVYVPEGNDWLGGLNDQIAYGNMQSMKTYCDCVNHIIPICSRGVIYHPETILRILLQCIFQFDIKRFEYSYKIER